MSERSLTGPFALALALGLSCGPAVASVYVTDGDTIVVNGEKVRLRSEAGPIDAPEMHRAKCELELFRAQAARERLRQIMAPNDFSIERHGLDKYGRTVGVVYSEGEDVGARLVREGHAKPWPKLTKADRPAWCRGLFPKGWKHPSFFFDPNAVYNALTS